MVYDILLQRPSGIKSMFKFYPLGYKSPSQELEFDFFSARSAATPRATVASKKASSEP